MYNSQRTRPKTKNTFIPKKLVSLPALLKKRTKTKRIHTIKAELAARTLYIVDGEEIVITSLDRKPFCCQEELSVMSRSELCRVVRELNHKLPTTLRINPLPDTPSAVLRCHIEEMMGFRHFKARVKAPTVDPQPIIQIATLHSHQGRGRRSPVSSFSSASSRSSAPYGLAVVNEMDEEFGDVPWNVSISKKDLSMRRVPFGMT